MLSINHKITSSNYQNKSNSNVNFKSYLVPTDYLKEGFDTAISQGYKGRDFLKAVKAILNDGLKQVIKIDGTKGSKMSKGQAKLHDIFVDGEKVVDADHQMGLIFDGYQCMSAIEKFAGKNKDISFTTTPERIDNIQRIVDEEARNGRLKDASHKQIIKELDSIKADYEKQIKEELVQLKNKIF